MMLLIFITGCYTQAICDIGNVSIVGDYKVTGIDGKLTIAANDWDCAIQDCIAYNQYINETSCVV